MNSSDNIPAKLLRKLKQIVGAKHLTTHPIELTLYNADALSLHTASPAAVVFPRSTGEIQKIVQACCRYSFPFTPRGAGTGLAGGAVSKGGLIIQMSKMNRILALDPLAKRAVVQPGVVNQELTDSARRFGLQFTPDPSSQLVATIGGNVATNAGGPHTLKYGVTADHILDLTVVLPDGSVVQTGSANGYVPGIDISPLFIGMEGTLGVITEIGVQLSSRPTQYHTFLLSFQEIARATECVTAIIRAGIIPTALEMMDQPVIQAVEAKLKAGFPTDVAAILIVELDDIQTDLESDTEKLRAAVTSFISSPITETRDAEQRQRLWRGRKHAAGAMGYLAPAYYTGDGVVPRNKLTELFASIQRHKEQYRMSVATLCHAGDGNVHPKVLYDPAVPGETDKALELSHEILRTCLKLGGSISGEHGVGAEKRALLSEMFTTEKLDLLHNIKSALDPINIANPHKKLPDSSLGQKQSLPLMGPQDDHPIIEYQGENLTITVSGKATYAQVQSYLHQFNQFLPLGPFPDSVSIQEIIDHNMLGHWVEDYGQVRRYLLNCLVKTGAGLIETGVNTLKDVTGYNLTRILIGAGGSLGNIRQATFRIMPLPDNLSVKVKQWIGSGIRLIVSQADYDQLVLILSECTHWQIHLYPSMGMIDIGINAHTSESDIQRITAEFSVELYIIQEGRCFPKSSLSPAGKIVNQLKSIFDPDHEFPPVNG